MRENTEFCEMHEREAKELVSAYELTAQEVRDLLRTIEENIQKIDQEMNS